MYLWLNSWQVAKYSLGYCLSFFPDAKRYAVSESERVSRRHFNKIAFQLSNNTNYVSKFEMCADDV